MIDFNAYSFYTVTYSLHRFEERVSKLIEEKGGNSKLTKKEVIDAHELFEQMEPECERIGLDEALKKLRGYRLQSIHPNLYVNVTLEKLSWELESLRESVEHGLAQKVFMYLPAKQAEYYDKVDLFGDKVSAKFYSADDDIREAGNCYASGIYTACVFHLMRVLEHGLRALAKRLKVTFPKNPKTPVDLKTWGEIIGAIEVAIRNLPTPKTLKESATSEFYNTAAAQFRFFKDAWRNNVMHTRTTYDEHQAMSVMVHVREFMYHLAARLK